MIRFKQFLNEDSDGKKKFSFTRADNLSDEEIIMWCKSNASEYLSNPTPIFRGDGFGHDAIYHTKDFERISKNTLNYYTQWIDNHPQWAAYPKRSKSLICSTSIDTANSYHQKVFRVIPSDDCKVGVVPADDMWYAFDKLRNFLDHSGVAKMNTRTMDVMSQALRSIIHMVDSDISNAEEEMDISDYGQTPLESNWSMLKGKLQEISPDNILDVVSANRGEWTINRLRALSTLAKRMNRQGFDSLYEMLEKLMDPHANGFKVVNPGQIPKLANNELWVGGGDCLLIRDKDYREDLFKELGLI